MAEGYVWNLVAARSHLRGFGQGGGGYCNKDLQVVVIPVSYRLLCCCYTDFLLVAIPTCSKLYESYYAIKMHMHDRFIGGTKLAAAPSLREMKIKTKRGKYRFNPIRGQQHLNFEFLGICTKYITCCEFMNNQIGLSSLFEFITRVLIRLWLAKFVIYFSLFKQNPIWTNCLQLFHILLRS